MLFPYPFLKYRGHCNRQSADRQVWRLWVRSWWLEHKSIAESNKNGNSDVFIEFILKMISETLIEVTEQEKNGATIYSRQVQELLRVMEYHMPYTASQLMSVLGLKSRSSFYRNYLEPALRQKLITMEIPDKPKSRNQRYLKM
jgi:hypothetical protein